MSSIKSQVEEKFQIPAGELVAVIYYRDRSYTSVSAYGVHLNHIEKSIKEAPMLGNRQFAAHKWSELKVVPQEGHVSDALTFGLDEGKVLLVSGDPPSP